MSETYRQMMDYLRQEILDYTGQPISLSEQALKDLMEIREPLPTQEAAVADGWGEFWASYRDTYRAKVKKRAGLVRRIVSCRHDLTFLAEKYGRSEKRIALKLFRRRV